MYTEQILSQAGGSLGHVSQRLARQFPKLHFIVQDYKVTCQKGEARLPDEFRSRISFQPFNIFEPQPTLPTKAVYLLRWIVHDWSDIECSQILGSIAQGMKPGDRIIISEFVRPEPGTGSLSLERAARYVHFPRNVILIALCSYLFY